MDIQLPKLDGFEATRQIRKIKPELPIIAQTAFVLAGEQEKSLQVGCNDYISKPINKKKLLNILDQYL
jgi:CheY-like chemotaxis protein